MNANIDEKVCSGCELCSKACADIFQIENGKAIVAASGIPVHLESTCVQIAQDCPAKAIIIGQAQAIMLTEDPNHYHSWIGL